MWITVLHRLAWFGLATTTPPPPPPKESDKPWNLSHMLLSMAAAGSERVNTSHSACGSRGRRAGRQCRGWPLTPQERNVEALSSRTETKDTLAVWKVAVPFCLQRFLIRRNKQRFHVNVLWGVCCSGICHFGTKFHPAASGFLSSVITAVTGEVW